MQTKHKKYTQDFSVPKDIKKITQDRGFYLYKWISPSEIKMSIEKDFLNALRYVAPVFAVLSIGAFLVVGLDFLFKAISMFLLVTGIGVIGLIIYLFFLALYRSYQLSKNAYVVLTDTSISIDGEVIDLGDTEKIEQHAKKIETTFEEKLFGESYIQTARDSLSDRLRDNLFGGYRSIIHMTSRGSKRSFEAIALLFILYTLYVLIVGASYFLGVIVLWALVLVMTMVNNIIMRLKGNKVMIINNKFEYIHETALNLLKEKKNLLKFLTQAGKSEWKDSLLDKINSSIGNINQHANNAINQSAKLKGVIEKSKYQKMFNFSVYNSWLKRQIYDPLEQIHSLLEQNLNTLKESKQNIEVQILETQDPSLSGPLKLQSKRLSLQISNISDKIDQIENYLNKLQK